MSPQKARQPSLSINSLKALHPFSHDPGCDAVSLLYIPAQEGAITGNVDEAGDALGVGIDGPCGCTGENGRG